MSAPALSLPGWVPEDVRLYIGHIEQGRSIRSLARAAGLHASTVLRRVRRYETRRDDPLVDQALSRIARARRRPPASQDKEPNKMTKMLPSSQTGLPDDDAIDREAKRILRRLAEPNACLAVSPGMDKAVVVRELEDSHTVRTAVLDRGIAEALALKDWIAGTTKGKISRYRLTQAGRAALKRLLSEEDAARRGMAEAPMPFADQHRDWGERQVEESGEGEGRGRRVRYNVYENPVAAIGRRKGKDGRPFLSEDLIAAAERLREDFELAQLGPRVAQNWDRYLTAGDRGSFGSGTGGGSAAAADRVAAALKELGPGLGDVVLRCCCFLEGMEQAEKRMGWSARSGKIVLRIALQRLKRHYDEQTGPSSDMIG